MNMLRYNIAQACGGSCDCPDFGECFCSYLNCGGLDYDKINKINSDFTITYLAIIGVGIIVVLFFLITLGFFLVYKHKKYEHPRKYAFKRSWRWWILIVLLSISIFIVLYKLRII